MDDLTNLKQRYDLRTLAARIIPGRKEKHNQYGKSGIYQITNLINGKIYIGQAIDIGNRWSVHKTYLRSNNPKENAHLRASFNKYGEENFLFEVLEYCPEEELQDAEQVYLDLIFDPFFFNQSMKYNISSIAGSPIGYKHTQDAKDKISKLNKGRERPDARERLSKSVAQINLLTKEIVNIFSSVQEASNTLKINHSKICQVARGTPSIVNSKEYYRKSAGGFGWEYINKESKI